MSGETGWAAADGVVRDRGVAMLPGADDSALVVVGCDPVLETLEALLDRRGLAPHVGGAGSSGAAGRPWPPAARTRPSCTGPTAACPSSPVPARGSTWRAGGRASGWTTPVAGRSSRRSWRGGAPGAARALGLQPAGTAAGGARDGRPGRALRQHCRRTPGRRAPRGDRRVRGRHLRAAARAHGLRFLPLETHEVELWIDERWVDHPGAQALGDLLSSAAFREAARLMGGYGLDGAGALRTLPQQERR